MRAYDWMVDFTPQKEWIDGQGLFLMLAFFFSELGAGLYLVSLLSGFWTGCIVGWGVSVVLGGLFHILYLGKPGRAWRAISRPIGSGLSRGLVFMSVFAIGGLIQIMPSLPFISSLPWESQNLVLTMIMIPLCILVIIHGFMMMSVTAAIPFWNSGILPLFSVSSGIWIGTQLGIGVGLMLGNSGILSSMETWTRWGFCLYAVLLLFYLWNENHASLAARESYKNLVKGHLSALFYFGGITVGLIIPAGITIYFFASRSTPDNYVLVFLRLICAISGDLAFRYCILKAGRYNPLISSNRVVKK